LIHINSLGSDYFIHDPLSHKLVGEKSGVIYSLGMELQIVVSKVDLDRRRIDFVLAIDMGAKKRSSKKVRSKKSKAKKSGSIKSVKIKTKK
jgi:ribonuclease R